MDSHRFGAGGRLFPASRGWHDGATWVARGHDSRTLPKIPDRDGTVGAPPLAEDAQLFLRQRLAHLVNPHDRGLVTMIDDWQEYMPTTVDHHAHFRGHMPAALYAHHTHDILTYI